MPYLHSEHIVNRNYISITLQQYILNCLPPEINRTHSWARLHGQQIMQRTGSILGENVSPAPHVLNRQIRYAIRKEVYTTINCGNAQRAPGHRQVLATGARCFYGTCGTGRSLTAAE